MDTKVTDVGSLTTTQPLTNMLQTFIHHIVMILYKFTLITELTPEAVNILSRIVCTVCTSIIRTLEISVARGDGEQAGLRHWGGVGGGGARAHIPADGAGRQVGSDQLTEHEVVDEVGEVGRDEGVAQGLDYTVLATAELQRPG